MRNKKINKEAQCDTTSTSISNFRFLHFVYFTHLKGSVVLILNKVSMICVSVT
jgi:hypothetical protein